VDLALHAAILRATHNEFLSHMTGTIAVSLAASRRITVKVPGGPRSALAFHRGVVASIVAADAERARYWMDALVTGAARAIEAVFHRTDSRIPI
jgi:DNA-binding FadR family transcriptional regulator